MHTIVPTDRKKTVAKVLMMATRVFSLRRATCTPKTMAKAKSTTVPATRKRKASMLLETQALSTSAAKASAACRARTNRSPCSRCGLSKVADPDVHPGDVAGPLAPRREIERVAAGTQVHPPPSGLQHAAGNVVLAVTVE